MVTINNAMSQAYKFWLQFFSTTTGSMLSEIVTDGTIMPSNAAVFNVAEIPAGTNYIRIYYGPSYKNTPIDWKDVGAFVPLSGSEFEGTFRGNQLSNTWEWIS